MVIFTLFFSMAIILYLVSKKVNIGYALIIGAVLLSLLNGRDVNYILKTIIRSLSEYTTLSLAATIALITVLGYMMEKYLLLDRMIFALERMLRSTKATIMLAPAIIGTLLVAGGALMSCPVVDKLGTRLNTPKDKNASINLIFRHALFFMFPLSPTLILAAQLGEFNIWDFIKLQYPIAIAMYVFGYIFFLRKVKDPKLDKIEGKEYLKSVLQFVLYSSPILISLVGAMAFNLPFYISLIFGIVLSIAINVYDKSKDSSYDIGEKVYVTMYKGLKIPMVIAIIGIMIFKNVVNDMDNLYALLNGLLERGLPVEILIIVSCLLISFSMASSQPSIALLFPMVLPLAPDYDTKLLYAMLIYCNAFIAYYLSPLHLCQVLTLEYFQVKLKDLYVNYRYVLPLTYLVMILIYVVNIWI